MEKRETFSSRLGFLLISAGCAIGLGNVWRFPYIVGQYGGGAFVLIYLAFLVLLGLPVMVMEFSVGRASKKGLARSFHVLEPKGTKWHIYSWFGLAGNYLLMMFYTVIAGWLLLYCVKMACGDFVGLDAAGVNGEFGSLMGQPGIMTLFMAIVVVVCMGVCSLGLQNGVEKITKVMMICLLAVLVVLVVRSLTLPGAAEGLKFYLKPDLNNLMYDANGNFVLGQAVYAAMGQAFFTFSLGIGALAIFGSYIGKEHRLASEAVRIGVLDTFVALMSGLVIFPAYFTFNTGAQGIPASEAGAYFLFSTLSSIFNNMGAGRLIGTLFFLFMVFAAFSTVIAVFENIMSFWLEWTRLRRWQIALINIVGISLLTLPFIFSNEGGLFARKIFLGRNFGDFEDFLVSNLALPVGSLVYVLFCTRRLGWGWDNYFAEVNAGNGLKVPRWMRPYMTYALPLIILVVLVMSLF